MTFAINVIEFLDSSMTQLKNQAIQTALTGDWKTAVEINKELLDEEPKDIDALNRLALAYQVLGKIKSAKSTYQKVLKIDPLNPIALRNLKQLKTTKTTKGILDSIAINNKFLEETGKTKVIELLNIAPHTVIQTLRTGQEVSLSIKRSKIFVLKNEKSSQARDSHSAGQYIGMLPDDIGRRLIKFIKSGSRYEAYIKSVNLRRVVIFIKESKRSSRFKNQPSFLSMQDYSLFDKKDLSAQSGKIKNIRYEEDQEKDYNEEEEEA